MNNTAGDVIVVDNLYKAYGTFEVLRGVTLRVAQGEAYGLLGPNGVGKSTLIHLMLGFLKPSRGRVRVLGGTPEQVRGRIGYVPERLRYHTRYSAREYLTFMGQFSDLDGDDLEERVDLQLNQVGLEQDSERTLGTFSKGMLQRIGIAQALLTDPELLLIDEPTSGLDPGGQRDVLNLLGDIRARGHTIFICTHYLHEVEQLCDRVGVLTQGKLAAEVVVQQLRAPSNSVTIQVSTMTNELKQRLQTLSTGVRCAGYTIIVEPNSPELQADILRLLLDTHVDVIAIEPLQSPLEQIYAQAVREGQPSQLLRPSGIDVPLAPQPSFSRPPITPPTPTIPDRPVARPTSETLLHDLLRRTSRPPQDTPEER